MKLLLIVTGMLALAVLLIPWLVVIGLVALIIPGLILAAMPTIFGYLLLTALIRLILPMPDAPATIVAGMIAMALGWIVAQPARRQAMAEFKAAQEDEIVPAGPIVPRGHIRVERTRFTGPSDRCDALCAALLATPGVESVTLVEVDDVKTVARDAYRLVPKGSVPDTGLSPDTVSAFRSYDGMQGHKQREADDKALAAAWALRLATTDTLVAGPARAESDMTIRMVDTRTGGPHVQRVEVRSGDTVLLRKSLVRHSMLAAPVHLAFQAHDTSVYWAWGRTPLSTGLRYAELKHQAELLAHLALSEPEVAQGSREELRVRLLAALDTPGDAPDIALASAWLQSFDYKAPQDEDVEIVARILADPRITDLKYFFKTHEKSASLPLRSAIATRILMPGTAPNDRHRLARLLKQMPEGTFATLTKDEVTILSKGQYRHDAAPFIERLADQGVTALKPLIEILEIGAALEPRNAREGVVRGARRGLARLGPVAKPALPVVLRLFGASGGRLSGESNRSREWRVAMVRMGLDPAELPWPKNWTPEQIARDRASIDKAVEAHDATWESGYSY